VPVDPSALANLNRMANTPDPRDFYRVSRVVLMPSLWRESLGRVAMDTSRTGNTRFKQQHRAAGVSITWPKSIDLWNSCRRGLTSRTNS
jgi:hypothetical protein